MAKSSDQMKNMVEEYLKTLGAKYTETTDQTKLKNPKVEWQFLVGKIHITKMSDRDDRILIHNPIHFGKESDKFNNLPNPEKFGTIHQINQFATLKDLSVAWLNEPTDDKTKTPIFKGLNIQSYIDETELARPAFYRKLDAVTGVVAVTTNLLVAKMKPEAIQDVSTDKQSKDFDFFQ